MNELARAHPFADRNDLIDLVNEEGTFSDVLGSINVAKYDKAVMDAPQGAFLDPRDSTRRDQALQEFCDRAQEHPKWDAKEILARFKKEHPHAKAPPREVRAIALGRAATRLCRMNPGLGVADILVALKKDRALYEALGVATKLHYNNLRWLASEEFPTLVSGPR